MDEKEFKRERGNPLAFCPYCSRQLDGWTPLENPEAVPKENDFSLCAYCKHLVIFRADQTVRKPTFSERKEFKRWLREHRRKKMN